MKPWSIVALAVFLSFAASAAVTLLGRPAASAGAGTDPDALTAVSLERLHLTLATVQDRQEELAARVENLARQIPPAPVSTRVPVGEIEAAIERWMAEHGRGTDPAADAAPAESEVATADLDAILDLLLGGDLTDLEQQELWQRLRDEGRIDEVIAEFERRAAADPNDPDLQVDLAQAYIQKIFEVGNSPLAGVFGTKADEAFDRALALDETHWRARFYKAISLSNWPAFIGKGPEAIRQFEILIEQQNRGPAQPEHAQTYFFLGNMYQQAGNGAKALEVWNAGLALFPDNAALREQVSRAPR
ncbi:MAG: hypothetical protein AB1726_08925 [Planctomycetota bacterium]